ncbi:Protein of unknown function [Gryllus bimaculatus]|nr:Protein of unknown function [Gryllus bimaculatus]
MTMRLHMFTLQLIGVTMQCEQFLQSECNGFWEILDLPNVTSKMLRLRLNTGVCGDTSHHRKQQKE